MYLNQSNHATFTTPAAVHGKLLQAIRKQAPPKTPKRRYPGGYLRTFNYHADIAQHPSTNYANVAAALEYMARGKTEFVTEPTIPEIRRLLPKQISVRTIHRALAHLRKIGAIITRRTGSGLRTTLTPVFTDKINRFSAPLRYDTATTRIRTKVGNKQKQVLTPPARPVQAALFDRSAAKRGGYGQSYEQYRATVPDPVAFDDWIAGNFS